MALIDMTTKTNTFSFAGLELRSITIDGKPWFVAKDVCDITGIQQPANACRALQADERRMARKYDRTTSDLFTSGRGASQLVLISEAGLYTLVMRAQKANPKAAEFQTWVTGTGQLGPRKGTRR